MLLLALIVLAAGFSFAAPSMVMAQEKAERSWSLNRLFSPRQPDRVEPRSEIAKPKVRKKKQRVVREPVDPQATVVVKWPDARVVLVVGDFLGSGLAEGLTTVFTQSPDVRVVDRTSGSSGFVRDDFYDWPQKIGELIDSEKPAAIVVMLGANDRQQMPVGEVRETLRSENWTREYGARTQALAKAISDRKVPFIWVGMPAFKSSKMLLDMLAFNDVYRAAAASVGAEFVDIWDGFVDENGAYMSNGPDVNGQPARLRAADGINLARPGKRKVAFYAEKPLYKLLGETADPAASVMSTPTTWRPFGAPFGAAIPAPAEDMDVVVGSSDLGPVDPARPVWLRSPALDGGAELLGQLAEPRHDARTPGEKLAIEGIAPAAVPGRADDFSWPHGSSTAMASAKPNTTATKGIVPAVLPEPVDDVSPPRQAPVAIPTPPAPVPVAMDVPAALPDPVLDFLPPHVVPSEFVAVAEIPAGLETTRAKGTVSEAMVGGAADRSPDRTVARGAAKLPKSLGPEGSILAPSFVSDRIDNLFVLQAAPSEVVLAPATLSPEEIEVFAAKGAVSRAQPYSIGSNAPMRFVPRRAIRPPVSSGPVAEAFVVALPPQADDFAPPHIVPAAVAPMAVVASPSGKNAAPAASLDIAGDAAPVTPQPAPTKLISASAASAAPSSGSATPAPVSQPPALSAPAMLPESAGNASLPQAAPTTLTSTSTGPGEDISPVRAAPSSETMIPVQASQPPALPAPTVLPESAGNAPLPQTTPAAATATPAAPAVESPVAPQAARPAASAAPTILPEGTGSVSSIQAAPAPSTSGAASLPSQQAVSPTPPSTSPGVTTGKGASATPPVALPDTAGTVDP